MLHREQCIPSPVRACFCLQDFHPKKPGATLASGSRVIVNISQPCGEQWMNVVFESSAFILVSNSYPSRAACAAHGCASVERGRRSTRRVMPSARLLQRGSRYQRPAEAHHSNNVLYDKHCLTPALVSLLQGTSNFCTFKIARVAPAGDSCVFVCFSQPCVRHWMNAVSESSAFILVIKSYPSMAACAAARIAIGTRYGEQLT